MIFYFDGVISPYFLEIGTFIFYGLWWPCLLMDRDEISNLYRGPSIDASYQVSVHLAEGFQEKIKM
jgi:hypothetical protein